MGPKQVSMDLQNKWDNKLSKWNSSPKVKKIRKMLTFLTNYKNADIDLTNIKLNRLVILNCLAFNEKTTIKLNNLLVNNLTILSLSTLFNKIYSTIRNVNITFNRKHSIKEYSLGHFIYPLQNARKLKEFTLVSMVKAHTLLINCNILAKCLENCQLTIFVLKNIELINVKGAFTLALSESKTLIEFELQSSDVFSNTLIDQIFDSLKNLSQLRKLTVTDKYHHQQVDWRGFSKLIKSSKCLEKVELNGREIMYSGNEETMEDAMITNKSIKTIVFKEFDGAASALAITLIGRMIHSQLLRHLDLSYINISRNSLVEAIASMISSCKLLSKLIMIQTLDKVHPTISPILFAISQSQTLAYLDLSQNIFEKEEIIVLCNLMNSKCALKVLKLCSCNLSDEYFEAIFEKLINNVNLSVIDLITQQYEGALYQCVANLLKVIEYNETLTEIYLYGNSFTAENIHLIMDYLSRNNKLKKFSIDMSGARAEGMEKLATVFKTNKSLSEFSIKSRKAILDLTLPFSALAINTTLVVLDINCKEFSNECISSLGSSLKPNCILEVLKLNGIMAKGAPTALTNSLKVNRGIKYITLYHSGIVKNEALHFFDFLETNNTLQYLNIYLNGIDIEKHHVNPIIRMLLKSKGLKYLGIGKLSIDKEYMELIRYIQSIVTGLTIDIF